MHKKIRHALISGGTGGIGTSIVETFLSNEITVTCLGRCEKSFENLKRAVGSCDRLSFRTCDVTLRTEVNGVLKELSKDLGVIDALICCAGGVKTKPFHKLTDSDWHAVMNLNLHGTFNCIAEVINGMRSQKFGRVVNVASTAGLKGYAYVSGYCAAKHAVVGLTRALAEETATLGVTVNAVCPGYTDTSIIRTGVENISKKTGRSQKEALEHFTSVNPQKRLITPKEVSSAVAWLCSENSDAITGQCISVSAGEVM